MKRACLTASTLNERHKDTNIPFNAQEKAVPEGTAKAQIVLTKIAS